MKANLFTGILLAFLLTGLTANAQMAYSGFNSQDDANVIVNNYYDNYDYYYSSRINRFHRSYAAFEYYAPVYTDSYWYTYQPFSWGVSIYGGNGFGMGYVNPYPVYNYGYAYSPGWADPYYGSYYYGGYDPYFYSSWYVAPVVNIRIGYGWPNYYYGYNGHDHHYSHHYYESHHGYNNSYNNYNNYNNHNYYSSGSTSTGNSYRRTPPDHSTGTYNKSSSATSTTLKDRSAGGSIRNTGTTNSNRSSNGNKGNNNGAGSSNGGSKSTGSFNSWDRSSSRSSVNNSNSGNSNSRSQYGNVTSTRKGNPSSSAQNMKSRYPAGSTAGSNGNSSGTRSGSSASKSSGSGKSSSKSSSSSSSSSSSDKSHRR